MAPVRNQAIRETTGSGAVNRGGQSIGQDGADTGFALTDSKARRLRDVCFSLRSRHQRSGMSASAAGHYLFCCGKLFNRDPACLCNRRFVIEQALSDATAPLWNFCAVLFDIVPARVGSLFNQVKRTLHFS